MAPPNPPDPEADRVFAVLNRLGGRIPAHLRDDVVQEAALRLLACRSGWGAIENLGAYCWTTLRSAMVRVMENNARTGEPLELEEATTVLGDDAPRHAAQAELRQLLRLLHPTDAEVLRLRYGLGMTIREVVDRMHSEGRPATVRSVESRLCRARARLRDLLLSHGYETGTMALTWLTVALA